jgi:uracil-DNA glycosylase family 4
MRGFFSLSEVQAERPTGLIPKCGSCGLYRTCRTPKIEPYGEGTAGVLIVGEAPGQTEDVQGRPFVGKAGQLLRETLSGLGHSLDRDAVTTNALICRPPENAAPTPKQISFCRPNLLNAIRENEPRVIITLGKPALAAVIREHWKRSIKRMEPWVGWRIPLDKYWLCPTYHPSFVLRANNPLIESNFEAHLEAAFALDEAPPEQENYARQIEVLYDEEAISSALSEIDDQGGWTAVDYETNCLKPEYVKARAVSFAVSNGKRTISYPLSRRTLQATGQFLRSKRTRKIASNFKFEERWTRFIFGFGVRRWGWDTMLATHCLDNREGICSLKFQALVHLGVPSYNENVEPYLESGSNEHYNRIHEVKMDTLLFYGGMDVILEFRIAMKQRKEMGYED